MSSTLVREPPLLRANHCPIVDLSSVLSRRAYHLHAITTSKTSATNNPRASPIAPPFGSLARSCRRASFVGMDVAMIKCVVGATVSS
jgi:hypothetical protein